MLSTHFYVRKKSFKFVYKFTDKLLKLSNNFDFSI